MFRAGLLLIIRRINSVETANFIVMRYVDWLLAGSSSIPILPAASQHNAWLYQLLFKQS